VETVAETGERKVGLLKLTPREQEVLSLYLREGDLKKVAETLGLSINAVKTQRGHIMRKLCVNNTVQPYKAAFERGLVNRRVKAK